MQMPALPWPRGSNLLLLIAMGGLGYVGQSFCHFAALRHATAGLTAPLLYLYPAIVTVLSALLARRRLSLPRMLVVATALLGAGLAVGAALLRAVAGCGGHPVAAPAHQQRRRRTRGQPASPWSVRLG